MLQTFNADISLFPSRPNNIFLAVLHSSCWWQWSKTHTKAPTIRTVQHLDIIKVLFTHQLMRRWVVLKNNITNCNVHIRTVQHLDIIKVLFIELCKCQIKHTSLWMVGCKFGAIQSLEQYIFSVVLKELCHVLVKNLTCLNVPIDYRRPPKSVLELLNTFHSVNNIFTFWTSANSRHSLCPCHSMDTNQIVSPYDTWCKTQHWRSVGAGVYR